MDIDAFFQISYGLYIVGATDGQRLNGYISNTVFQVTAEPPRLAIACSKKNYSAEIITTGKAFSVSVLRQQYDAGLIGTFGYRSGRDVNKFEGVDFITGQTGSPIVTRDCLAWFDCRLEQTFDVGSHMLFIGQVVNNGLTGLTGDPLTYTWFRDVKKGKAPANAPTHISEAALAARPQTNLPKYYCTVCGHVYDPVLGDPAHGIDPGTAFDDLPDGWSCPICGADQEDFALKK